MNRGFIQRKLDSEYLIQYYHRMTPSCSKKRLLS